MLSKTKDTQKNITNKALKKAKPNYFVKITCINKTRSLLAVLISVYREMKELNVNALGRRMKSLV